MTVLNHVLLFLVVCNQKGLDGKLGSKYSQLAFFFLCMAERGLNACSDKVDCLDSRPLLADFHLSKPVFHLLHCNFHCSHKKELIKGKL